MRTARALAQRQRQRQPRLFPLTLQLHSSAGLPGTIPFSPLPAHCLGQVFTQASAGRILRVLTPDLRLQGD